MIEIIKKWEQLHLTLEVSNSERGTKQLLEENSKTVQNNSSKSFSYLIWISKGLPWQGPVREFDLCNVFDEGLYGVKFIEGSSY